MLENSTFTRTRQELILQKLKVDGRVFCTQLAEELQVSEHTIRRDLEELAREGACRRVHGGAINNLPLAADFNSRAAQDEDAKDSLGKAGARLIRSGACVFIDAGTTNLAVARSIAAEASFTAVTNTPAIATELLRYPNIEVIILGGRLNSKTGGSVGITALQQVQGMHFDQCIIGACALDAVSGLTVFEYDDAEFKRALVAQSEQVIALLTSDKMSGAARYQVMACDQISALVVEHSAPPSKVAPFREMGIEVIHTDPT